ncbi:uncharacterized protein BP01DRAFT_82820 [Aspergillus saccharolyticus JOP 1030-1]|uniref:Uncharacterized protein n=1 Tax=Aspergillus saccharolyticus JOP 1030-1 TaxID=1450539 RepID=A0A319ABY3_9EURO|nr:hypothetical protein BP01DRAFT_82820 [Aspergillus saccharolyticus JOP 1030-1]PYH44422.1 hypothetical protein BP01DRAFT_82820 [Aspergillus saccharolyticus JOP 1030-1]
MSKWGLMIFVLRNKLDEIDPGQYSYVQRVLSGEWQVKEEKKRRRGGKEIIHDVTFTLQPVNQKSHPVRGNAAQPCRFPVPIFSFSFLFLNSFLAYTYFHAAAESTYCMTLCLPSTGGLRSIFSYLILHILPSFPFNFTIAKGSAAPPRHSDTNRKSPFHLLISNGCIS